MVAERRRGARGIKLRADSVQGVVRLSLPARGGVAEALTLLERHGEWLAAQVAGWPKPVPFVPGALIPFDGGQLRLVWHPGHSRQPRREGEALVVGGPESMLAGRTLCWLKAAALADVEAATHRLAGVIGRTVAQVRVGDPRARWGSCASGRSAAGGRIAYSWRLILAPGFVRGNVVAHEVAHLVHGNHGCDFHALLAQLDPHEASSRRWLRRHGAGLHWVGRDE